MINTLEDLKNNIDNLSNAKILQYSLKFDYVDGFEKCLTYYKQKYNGFESGILIKTVKEKHYNIFKFLVNNLASDIICNSRFDLKTIIYIIETKKIDINTNYGILLRNAAYVGNYDVVKYLINNGANIHFINEQALNDSITRGHYKIVKLLIENNAIIHDYKKCIIDVCKSGNLNLFKYIINLDININSEAGLTNAIKYNKLNIIKYVIKYGIKIELEQIVSTLSYTNIDTFKYIMNNYMNTKYDAMNYLNKLLNNSAMYAQYDKIEYLLNIGADVEILNDYDDDIIFDIVLKYNRMKKISKILK